MCFKSLKLKTLAFPRVQTPMIRWPESTLYLISVRTFILRKSLCTSLLSRKPGLSWKHHGLLTSRSSTCSSVSWHTCPCVSWSVLGEPHEVYASGHLLHWGWSGPSTLNQTRESIGFMSKPPCSAQSLHLLGDKYRTVPPDFAELAFSIKVMTLVCWEIFWRLISLSIREKMNKELLPVSSNT